MTDNVKTIQTKWKNLFTQIIGLKNPKYVENKIDKNPSHPVIYIHSCASEVSRSGYSVVSIMAAFAAFASSSSLTRRCSNISSASLRSSSVNWSLSKRSRRLTEIKTSSR